MSILEWRDAIRTGATLRGITPPGVAAALHDEAAKTMALVSNLRPMIGTDKELRLTLGDFEAYAHLGNYYAEKILAAAGSTSWRSRRLMGR